jgi:methylmalonyl-CoA/ethylmalonyl-CoA epimerase
MGSAAGPVAAGLRFHHIGFVVESIERQVDGFIRTLAARWDERIFTDPIQKVRVTFLRTGEEPSGLVELVEPADSASPVRNFLAKGGGLHHLCYEIPDLDAHLEYIRSQGATIVKKPQPAVAFDGRRIAWVVTAERLLLEFIGNP